MSAEETVASYLSQTGKRFRSIGARMWMIRDEQELGDLIVTLNEPVVLFQVKLFDVPASCDRLRLYEELLRLNAEDMVHGAYGLQGGAVVAMDTLQAENLDFNEFQATVDALGLSIATHMPHLGALAGLRAPAGGSS